MSKFVLEGKSVPPSLVKAGIDPRPYNFIYTNDEPRLDGVIRVHVGMIEDLPEDKMAADAEEVTDTLGMLARKSVWDTSEFVDAPGRETRDGVRLLSLQGAAQLSKLIMAGQQTVAFLGIAEGRDEIFISGATKATEHMMLANQPLLPWCVKKRGVPIDDTQEAISEGQFGLSRAVASFDYRKELTFANYAKWWINQAVSKHQDKQRYGTSDSRVISLMKALNRVEAKLGPIENLDKKDLLEASFLSEKELEKALAARYERRKPVSLHTKIGVDDGGELIDVIQDESQSVDLDWDGMLLERAMSKLPLLLQNAVKDRVIREKRGLKGDKDWSLSSATAMLLHPSTGLALEVGGAEYEFHKAAECNGIDVSNFFGGLQSAAKRDRAKAICHDCPVIQACLNRAIDNKVQIGVWGGELFKKGKPS